MTEPGKEVMGGAMGIESSPDRKGSFFSTSENSEPGKAPLSILVKITKIDGESLLYGEVNVELIEEIFQNNAGITPFEVLVFNDQDALVDLADRVSVTEIAMAVHGDSRLRDDPIQVGCLILGRDSLMSMEKEREEYWLQKEDLEKERLELEARKRESRMAIQEDSIRMKSEFAGYQMQMNELMMRVTEQLNSLEQVRKETEEKLRVEQQEGCNADERIDKLPSFPLFSGTEPTPKNECRIETFLFQVRGARKNLTDQAV